MVNELKIRAKFERGYLCRYINCLMEIVTHGFGDGCRLIVQRSEDACLLCRCVAYAAGSSESVRRIK